MIYEFVVSGPAYNRLMPSSYEKDYPENQAKVTSIIVEGIEKIRSDVAFITENDQGKISLLYNAYTEKLYDAWLRRHRIFGFEALYADSGGLQAVTRGHKIDDDLKRDVYKTQSNSNYAMCFDEIPCSNLLEFDIKQASRSTISNKIYHPERAEECAIKTAQNIRGQIECLASLDSKAKVFYIVQGNNVKDMVDWFRTGYAVLDDWHWNHVGGLAMADTCIGNGIQESVDMLEAYKIIRDMYGADVVKNHMHLLGVGSVSRLVPLIRMGQGGFLPNDLRISFDSTTYSMSYVIGRFCDIETNLMVKSEKTIDNRRNDNDREFNSLVARYIGYFYDIYKKYCPSLSEGQVIDHITKHNRSIATTINEAEGDLGIVVRANVPLLNTIQVIGFMRGIAQEVNDDFPELSEFGLSDSQHRKSTPVSTAMDGLKFVSTSDDLKAWRDVNASWFRSSRKRLMRAEPQDDSHTPDVYKPTTSPPAKPKSGYKQLSLEEFL